jgi:hypothetical protein
MRSIVAAEEILHFVADGRRARLMAESRALLHALLAAVMMVESLPATITAVAMPIRSAGSIPSFEDRG